MIHEGIIEGTPREPHEHKFIDPDGVEGSYNVQPDGFVLVSEELVSIILKKLNCEVIE